MTVCQSVVGCPLIAVTAISVLCKRAGLLSRFIWTGCGLHNWAPIKFTGSLDLLEGMSACSPCSCTLQPTHLLVLASQYSSAGIRGFGSHRSTV